MCVCAFCRDCYFLVALRRGWQALAQLGGPALWDELASRPQPSGTPWHRVPKASGAHSPDPVPALSLSLLPLSRAPCSAHWGSHLHGNRVRSTGLTAARGSKGGKGVHASQPLSGTHTSRAAVSLAELSAAEGGGSWSSGGGLALSSMTSSHTLLPSCVVSSTPHPV